jgi:hypothetical protein
MVFTKLSFFDVPKCEFYCSCCDALVVSSDDQTTGFFYTLAGSELEFKYDFSENALPTIVDAEIGAPRRIIFAVCSGCAAHLTKCPCQEEPPF